MTVWTDEQSAFLKEHVSLCEVAKEAGKYNEWLANLTDVFFERFPLQQTDLAAREDEFTIYRLVSNFPAR